MPDITLIVRRHKANVALEKLQLQLTTKAISDLNSNA
jgi:hypothetical protein